MFSYLHHHCSSQLPVLGLQGREAHQGDQLRHWDGSDVIKNGNKETVGQLPRKIWFLRVVYVRNLTSCMQVRGRDYIHKVGMFLMECVMGLFFRGTWGVFCEKIYLFTCAMDIEWPN